MRSLSTLLLLSLLLAPPVRAQTLLILGDSLSAGYGIPAERGWVTLLEQRLVEHAPGWQVVNASISGETTAGGRTRLPALLQRHRPALVVVELGANDGLRGMPPARMRENLAAIIEESLAAEAGVLLLGIRLPPNYGPRYSEQFHAVYHQLAKQHGLPLVPFFLEGVTERPEWMQPDRYHPNARAQPRLLENVWPALAPLLESP